jgi:KipI family sensor histidine kinase inhibitor
MKSMNFQAASDRSLLISFAPEVSPRIHRNVFRLYQFFRHRQFAGVYNLHPAYASLLVDFDPLVISHAEIESRVRHSWQDAAPAGFREPRLVRISVVYGGDSGPDLAEVSLLTGLSSEAVVRLHSSVDFLVYFLGFSPGFPYLGGLPPELATPRLPSPRQRVPAGSVALGGNQTGVYPLASPGGWRIIGRTDLRLFDPNRNPASLLQMGDRVRFEPAP